MVSEHQPLGRRRRRRRVRGSAGGGDLSAGATGAASAGDGGGAVPEQLAALEGLVILVWRLGWGMSSWFLGGFFVQSARNWAMLC